MKFPIRENIDRWLFDFTEGNLNPEQEQLLADFITQNPDLELDMDAWQQSKVTPTEVHFTRKNELLKKRRWAPFVTLLVLLLGGLTSLWYFIDNQSHERKQFAEQVAFSNSAKSAKNTLSKKGADSTIPSGIPIDAHASIPVQNNERINNSNQAIFDASSKELVASSSLLVKKVETNTTTIENRGEVNELDQNAATEIYSTLETGLNTVQSNRLNLRPIGLVEGYRSMNEALITSEMIAEEKAALGTDVNLKMPKMLKVLDKVLSKDVASTSSPDFMFIASEQSHLDVMNGMIGTNSQTRFMSTSSIRRFGENNQKMMQQLSLDGYSRGAKSGLGLQANYDYYGNGVIQNWNIGILYSPKIALFKRYIFEPVVKFKMGNQLLNSSKVINGDAVSYDPNRPQVFNFDTTQIIGRKLWYRDLDAGFTFHTNLFYVGFQAYNLLNHFNNIYTNNPSEETSYASTDFRVVLGTQYVSKNSKVVFSPYFTAERWSNNKNYSGGFSLKISSLMLGGMVNTQKNCGVLFGLSREKMGVYVQSILPFENGSSALNWTHQLTLRLNTATSKKIRRYITI